MDAYPDPSNVLFLPYRRWNYWYEREDNEVPYHNHYDEVGLSGSGGDTTD